MIKNDRISVTKLSSKEKTSDDAELKNTPRLTTEQSNMICKLTEEAKMLHMISKELLMQNPIDYDRVNEVKAKLKSLDILGSDEQAAIAAKRIANRLIEMDNN